MQSSNTHDADQKFCEPGRRNATGSYPPGYKDSKLEAGLGAVMVTRACSVVGSVID